MNLIATTYKRVFIIQDKGQSVELADPERSLSPQAVLNFYANSYPLLTTAKVSEGQVRNDRIEYRFDSVMGTKG
jgi:PRTRC genetic system protein C